MTTLNKKTTLIAISTLLAGLVLGWFLFSNSATETAKEHNHNVEAADETIWTCSMHPQIRKNEPGQCPICGMELIPLKSDEGESDARAVHMSSTAMQLAQVQTVIVGNNNAEKSIQLNGKVQTDERALFTQSSHIPGRVEKLTVNFTGEFVSKGQVIAYVYSPNLVTAQEELLEAQKIKETQPALFNAAKEKLKSWKLTDKQIDKILNTNQTLKQFPILTDISGYITEKMVNPGDYIKQGEALYKVVDLSRVWVLFDIYESDISWIKKGDPISYTVQSLPGKTFKGTISYIDPVIDPKTRVAKARVETSNPNLLLKPEMFVSGTVTAKVETNTTSLTVPKTAVMWTGKRSVVYVMQSSDKGVYFRMREVTLGPALGESYIIESGLQVGEEIAVNGTFSIDAAAQLAGKPSMMNPEGSVATSAHKHGNSPDSQMENIPNTTKKTAVSKEIKKALLPLFNSYFELKSALVKDDVENAKNAGKSMRNALSEIDMNLFKDEAHALWMQQSAILKKALEHIEHQKNIKAIREKFIGISNATIAINASFRPLSKPVYVQHCPMANSNKGADWLSLEEEILNPYFGAAMSSCGEVTKVIK